MPRRDGGGSSTMPHKRNPVARGARPRVRARRARAGSRCSPEGEHEHERAAGAWHAEWNALSRGARAHRRRGRRDPRVPRRARGRRRPHAREHERRSLLAERDALVERGPSRTAGRRRAISARPASSSTARSRATGRRSDARLPLRRRRAARPCSCSRAASARRPRCGTRSCRRLARRYRVLRVRPARPRRARPCRAARHGRATSARARSSRCSTSSASSARRSAGSRSAAWSACGSAPSAPERIDRLVLACTGASLGHAGACTPSAPRSSAPKGSSVDRRRRARALVHAGVPRLGARRGAILDELARIPRRGLRRMLRGGRRLRLPRPAARASRRRRSCSSAPRTRHDAARRRRRRSRRDPGVARASASRDAAHLANVEQPDAFSAAVLAPSRGKDRRMTDDAYERGMKVRREVLGDEHVDRATSGDRACTRRLPGPHHPLRVGRDLVAAGPRPAHPQLHHADGARRARPLRRARAAHPRGAQRTASPTTRSARCCCSAPSTAACPRRTAPSTSSSECSTRTAAENAGRDRRRRAGRARRSPGCSRSRASSRSCSRHREPRVLSSTASAPAFSSRGRPSCCASAGVGERMDREGIVHGGIYLQFDGERHHVPMQRADRAARSSSTARPRSSRT